MFIDTHCHLDFADFDKDRDEVIARAKAQGLSYIINIGSTLQGSLKSLELSRQYDFIYASIGIHPHDADDFDEDALSKLSDLAQKDKVAAIGEIGLDYYRNLSSPENQRKLFNALLKLANDLGLPVIMHTRNAQEDTLKILKNLLPKKVVVHCFSGDSNFLKECLNLGFFVSFTCNITYKNASTLRELIKIIPLERLMLETDAPYLAPQELRGRRNEPAYLKYVAQEIAQVRQMSIEEVAKVTSDNAKGFFNLR